MKILRRLMNKKIFSLFLGLGSVFLTVLYFTKTKEPPPVIPNPEAQPEEMSRKSNPAYTPNPNSAYTPYEPSKRKKSRSEYTFKDFVSFSIDRELFSEIIAFLKSPYFPRIYRSKYHDMIVEYLKRYADYNPLATILIKNIETPGDNPSAVSYAGAVGLFQIMPSTAQSLMKYDPYLKDEANRYPSITEALKNPDINIRFHILYLNNLYVDNVIEACGKYFAGKGSNPYVRIHDEHNITVKGDGEYCGPKCEMYMKRAVSMLQALWAYFKLFRRE